MKKTLFLLIILFFSILVRADFFKVSTIGGVLNLNEPAWDCVFDDETNLYWEVKSSDKGLRYKENTYTWYNGITGNENSEYSYNCNWDDSCNTNRYIAEINKAELCSFNDWRLPKVKELQTLTRYYENNALIDLNFFPNTQFNTYWSSEEINNNEFVVYEVPFIYGGSIARDKSFDAHIRLVRSGAEKTN